MWWIVMSVYVTTGIIVYHSVPSWGIFIPAIYNTHVLYMYDFTRNTFN